MLFSNTGGRTVTMAPGPVPDCGPSEAQGSDGEALKAERGVEDFSGLTSHYQATFSAGVSVPFNATSEAYDLADGWPDLSALPTHSRKYELGKRIFDVALAILIFPLVAILIVVIAAMIALTSDGPIFFRHRRIGQHGREFLIWKFRTMHTRADWILTEYLKHSATAREEWHVSHKLRVDPRITALGRMLRKTSLDELPQIFNVLSGDMSFVGPRPIVRAESMKYAQRFPYYLAAVPGITGLWQVSGRCDVSYETRTLLDETYVCKWSMLRDIWILLKTPRAVVNRNGAY